ncbi:hypothetical protein T09_10634, partial [Trichinella sp. T9]
PKSLHFQHISVEIASFSAYFGRNRFIFSIFRPKSFIF